MKIKAKRLKTPLVVNTINSAVVSEKQIALNTLVNKQYIDMLTIVTYDKIKNYEGLPQKQIRDAVDMVNKKEMWIYLKKFVPRPDEGFVFTSDKKIKTLMYEIDVNGTMSGLEISIVMRLLQQIAKDNF